MATTSAAARVYGFRPELLEAQRGQGLLAQPVVPQAGEAVIEVPQVASFLMSPWDPECVLGLPEAAIERHLSPRYGWPRRIAFQPGRDPMWGYGLLVVRDGVLRSGPTRWDSS